MIMRKIEIIILAICFVTSCKTSHYTAINDRKEGVRITLPKGSESVSPKSLDGLYSGEFYKEYPAMKYPPMNAQIYTWDYIYQITTQRQNN
jgi:hypothetical protein